MKIVKKTQDLDLLEGDVGIKNKKRFLISAKFHLDYEKDADSDYIKRGSGVLEFVFSTEILDIDKYFQMDFYLYITKSTLILTPNGTSLSLMLGFSPITSKIFIDVDYKKYKKLKTFKLRFYVSFIGTTIESKIETYKKKWSIGYMEIENDEYIRSKSSQWGTLF